jgi:hypothetical protein
MDDAMTVREAAQALGVDGSVIRRRLRLGQMEGRLLSGLLWVIPSAEVARWRAMGPVKKGRPRKGESGR